jgi:CRP-like cAMP-binding protein
VPTYARQLLEDLHFSQSRILSTLPNLSLLSFDAGDAVLYKSCSVGFWCCIISGYVAASVPLDTGKRLPIQLFGQNEWFGEQPLITKQPSAHEYTCMTAVELITMPKNCFDSARHQDVNFGHFLSALVAWRGQQQDEKMVWMRLGSSPLRVVMGLAQFAEAARPRLVPRSMVDVSRKIDIPISQQHIADYCGVSRTLFSKNIQHLAKDGWLKLRYGGIELQKAETWRIFARKMRQRPCVVSRPLIADLLRDLKAAHAEFGPYRFPNLINTRDISMSHEDKIQAWSAM